MASSEDQLRGQVQDLVRQELFESAHLLGQFLTSLHTKSLRQRSEDHVLFADIVYGLGEHRRSLHYYRTAQAQAARARSGASASTPGPDAMVDGDQESIKNEAELRFKVAKCYVALKEYKSAQSELETVPGSHRTLQARLMLAKLYLQTGHESAATQVYLDCLKACPHALEAVAALTRLRVPAAIIKAQLPHAAAGSRDDLALSSWLPTLVDGHAAVASLDYDAACRHFSALELRAFPGNPHLLLAAAEAEAALGKLTTAATLFNHVRQTDPFGMAGMDTYAAVAAATGGLVDLNRIAMKLLETNPRRPEAWAAAALYWKAKRDPMRALAFAEKGAQLDESHPACHLITGDLALQIKNPDAAAQAFRKAVALRPDITSYTGLVRAYLAAGKPREAYAAAKDAARRAPGSARALVLQGDCFSEQPEKARKYYQQAIKKDPQSVEAATALADACGREGRFEEAAALLQAQVSSTTYRDPTQQAAVLAKLGLTLVAMRAFDRAIVPLQAALAIAPGLEDARRGLERADKLLRGVDPDAADDDDGMQEGDADPDAGGGADFE